jgi:hypothetical protein
MKWRFLFIGYGGALSVYGELEAWQVQIKVLRAFQVTLSAEEKGLELIPLDFDRDNLLMARDWMGQSSPGYAGRIKWAPLYPIGYYFNPLVPWSFNLLR